MSVYRLLFLIPLTVACLATTGCGGASDTATGATADPGAGSTSLSLVAYSTPQVVYEEAISAYNETKAGRNVSFEQSYGASGDQSRAVEGGLAADVVEFSLQPDMSRLVDDGIVDPRWTAAPHHGIVSNSVIAFVVRKGNPKGIHTWDDLLKPGVEVITPNPFTSGSAKWNLLGAYSHGGIGFVRKLLSDHVKVQPKSGRDATQAFTGGAGDVLISYENEAITAQQAGESLDYVVPAENVLIENPLAVTKTSKHPQQAKAFADFLWSSAGQRIFAKHGYRPVDEQVLREADFPTPARLKTVADLGGWDKLNAELFDPDKGAVAKIEEDNGISTAK